MSNVLRFPTAPDRDDRDDESRDGTYERREPMLRSVIGEVLRTERQDQQRTLADVASEAAVSLPYLSEVERGRKEVSSDVLAAICTALELDLADVLERSVRYLRPRIQGGSGIQMRAA